MATLKTPEVRIDELETLLQQANYAIVGDAVILAKCFRLIPGFEGDLNHFYLALKRRLNDVRGECEHEYETRLHPGCGAGCDDAPMSAYSHYSEFCKKCGGEKQYPQHTHEDHAH